MNETILRSIKFAGVATYYQLTDCNFVLHKNLVVQEILGLMFFWFFENISIPRDIMTF